MKSHTDKQTLTDAVYCTDGHIVRGSITIEHGTISHLGAAAETDFAAATESHNGRPAAIILPGIIDTHVHTREPGLTHKGDLATETHAAAAGGVTSVMDMPNVVPQTTSLQLLQERTELGARHAFVNYSFLFGATASNVSQLRELNPEQVPAVKLFMGSSTGDMLVDGSDALHAIFRESPLPIVAHCESQPVIADNLKAIQAKAGADPDVAYHHEIRSRQACIASSQTAIELSRQTGTRLHIAHITTAEELNLPHPAHVTMEACVPHLLFTDADYARLGTRIKCNPAIKTAHDRDELRRALSDGRIASVATDHAPHLLAEKQGGCVRAASGMPMVQFSLVAMLDLVEQGILSLPRMVHLMCHQPAAIFAIAGRGHIAEGMQADLVRVERQAWQLAASDVVSRCGWSPLEGHRFAWKVAQTWVNGCLAYENGLFAPTNSHAMALRFNQQTAL